jgi:hypothetical protein
LDVAHDSSAIQLAHEHERRMLLSGQEGNALSTINQLKIITDCLFGLSNAGMDNYFKPPFTEDKWGD